MNMETIRFLSGGVECAGDFYLPEQPDQPAPGIICGESGAKVKEMVADTAQYFVGAGFAVLAVDYRGFGASDGQPRGQLFPERQVEDFRSAVSYLQGRGEIDSQRIGLWGNSVAGSVVIQAAVFDRRVRCVVAQSPAMLNGWRATLKLVGRPAFHDMFKKFAADFEKRRVNGVGESIKWLHFNGLGDAVSQSYVDLAETYPTFRNEILLESHEHFLAWAPEYFIEHLSPTPLMIVTNGGWDPYHALDEVQIAYAKAGEPKRLEVLPFDAMGLYVDPGKRRAMEITIEWFDLHLRRSSLVEPTPKAQETEIVKR